jgi:uncharacterized protein (UPF0179 family)
MVLKAKNKVEGFETVEVSLKDIHILVDPNASHHGVKYKACSESLEKLQDDMIDSIIVKSKKERDEVNKSTYIFFEEYP